MGIVDPVKALRILDKYAVTRLSHKWPSCRLGADVDILVHDAPLSATLLADYLRASVDHTSIQMVRAGTHIHVDVIADGLLHLRFDLIDKIPWPFAVDSRLIHEAVDSAITQYGIQTPSTPYECVLRELEWQANGHISPHKHEHHRWSQAHWEVEAQAIWDRCCPTLHRDA